MIKALCHALIIVTESETNDVLSFSAASTMAERPPPPGRVAPTRADSVSGAALLLSTCFGTGVLQLFWPVVLLAACRGSSSGGCSGERLLCVCVSLSGLSHSRVSVCVCSVCVAVWLCHNSPRSLLLLLQRPISLRPPLAEPRRLAQMVRVRLSLALELDPEFSNCLCAPLQPWRRRLLHLRRC
jgi:hypothetical protein